MDMPLQPLVSVIVPVYKVEKYLDKCVQSIRNQSIQNIEIVLVDDGSPDSCGEMCDRYAEIDRRIIVLHKENGGLSDARNVGIERSSADLVAFIDSDDYIEPDMIELLYNNLIKEKADISVCGIYNHHGEKVSTLSDVTGYYVADTKDAIKMELTSVSVSAVNKIYKKSLFNNVRFPKGKLYEDAHTMIPLILHADKVVIDMQPKYHYIHREDSITTKPYRPQIKSLIEANKNNMDLVISKYPDLRYEAEYRYFWAYCYVLDYMCRTKLANEKDKKDKTEIVSFLRKNAFRLLRNPYFLLTRKASIIVLLISERMYGCASRLYLKHS